MTKVDLLNSNAFQLLIRSVDTAALRQKVYANNIANVDTPGFKRSEVQFEQLLQEQINAREVVGYQTHPKHIPIGQNTSLAQIEPEITVDHELSMNNNGNNVDIDAEMALLAKNQLYYNLLVGQIGHEISMVRKAIGGGG